MPLLLIQTQIFQLVLGYESKYYLINLRNAHQMNVLRITIQDSTDHGVV